MPAVVGKTKGDVKEKAMLGCVIALVMRRAKDRERANLPCLLRQIAARLGKTKLTDRCCSTIRYLGANLCLAFSAVSTPTGPSKGAFCSACRRATSCTSPARTEGPLG
jgi:hypothetical protein